MADQLADEFEWAAHGFIQPLSKLGVLGAGYDDIKGPGRFPIRLGNIGLRDAACTDIGEAAANEIEREGNGVGALGHLFEHFATLFQVQSAVLNQVLELRFSESTK